LFLAAVILIDAWLLYRFYSKPADEAPVSPPGLAAPPGGG
jgi:hypothetical protein